MPAHAYVYAHHADIELKADDLTLYQGWACEKVVLIAVYIPGPSNLWSLGHEERRYEDRTLSRGDILMTAVGSREKQRTRAIAGEYRSKGYEVIEEPTQEQLPDFLSGYHPDLLARKGDEARVVVVKSRASLAQEPQIRDLARLLHTKPNWNFELVLLGEKKQMSLPEGAYPFDREDILSRLQASERLLELGFPEAALLLAWSSAEATIRLLTTAEGIVFDRLTPVYILKQAVMHGVISRDEYNSLMKAMQYRNVLVHGFKIVDLDAALVKELISTTQRLLQEVLLNELAAGK